MGKYDVKFYNSFSKTINSAVATCHDIIQPSQSSPGSELGTVLSSFFWFVLGGGGAPMILESGKSVEGEIWLEIKIKWKVLKQKLINKLNSSSSTFYQKWNIEPGSPTHLQKGERREATLGSGWANYGAAKGPRSNRAQFKARGWPKQFMSVTAPHK